MTWQPGHPVLSVSDCADRQAWRKARKLDKQRQRRAKHPRIDYSPCNEALALIRELTHGRVGGDQSSVIDAFVLAAIRNKTGRSRNGAES